MYDDLLPEYKRKQYCPYIHHIKNWENYHINLFVFTMFTVSRHWCSFVATRLIYVYYVL